MKVDDDKKVELTEKLEDKILNTIKNFREKNLTNNIEPAEMHEIIQSALTYVLEL